MSIRLFYISLILTLFIQEPVVFAQSDDSSYQVSEDLTIAREKIDYSDDVIEKKEKKKDPEFDSSDIPNFNFSDLFGVLLIVLLLGVVIAILYFVIGNENLRSPKSRRIKELNLEAVEHIEDDLENQDVAFYLKQAIDKEQYRIAIRLHYLLIIKKLTENKFIKWKKDKTNRDYINETVSYPFSDKFRSSTSIFEKVWYGERSVQKSDFNKIYEQFDGLSKQISK